MAIGSTDRRAVNAQDTPGPGVQRDGQVWRVRSWDAARQVLRERGGTTQAGFTSEAIPHWLFRHRPTLIADGPEHDRQRRKAGRFLSPAVVDRRYTGSMRASAAAVIDRETTAGVLAVDEAALHYSVSVARRVVGLESSSVAGMSRRLERFFTQPPFDIARPGLGRTRRQWAQAARNGLAPIIAFFVADVLPAIIHARRHPADDIISHLIREGYRTTDILVECMTYGTAGMVTTREFITMACWHLLQNTPLRDRYLQADTPERVAVLEEILRLEPVVGHLYRRVREAFVIRSDGASYTLAEGDLVDVCVRATNTDPAVAGTDADRLCPARRIPSGFDRAGMSFSDGPHRCPGRALALAETDVFLTCLLRRKPALLTAPVLGWDNLVTGYTLRGMTVSVPGPTVAS